jgi:hemerythrin family non-heme iron protein
MGKFPIPEPYCWDESFCVFYANLDEEHKGLFNGIFECAGARGDAGKLKSLTQLVKDHFKDEEGMMQKANYADFPTHHTIHADFVSKLEALSVPLSDDTIHFAKEWLVDHIKGVDFNYKGKL